MKSIGRPLAVFAALTVALGCKHSPSDLEFHSLGVLKPGQPINASLRIENPFDEPAIVTGLSDACSVRVTNRENGILAAHESADLRLLAQASRIPGPSGFKLEVTFKAGEKKASTFHSFEYEVPPEPLLSVSQVWTGTSGDVVEVLGVSAPSEIAVQAPPGVTAKIHGKRIEFSGGDSQSTVPAQAMVTVRNAGSPDLCMPVDVISGPSLLHGRIYPDHIWTRSGPFTAQVIGMQSPLSVRVQPLDALATKVDGNLLVGTAEPGFSGPARITVTAPGGVSASAEVWVRQ